MRMEVVMQGRICRWGNSLALRIPAIKQPSRTNLNGIADGQELRRIFV